MNIGSTTGSNHTNLVVIKKLDLIHTFVHLNTGKRQEHHHHRKLIHTIKDTFVRALKNRPHTYADASHQHI